MKTLLFLVVAMMVVACDMPPEPVYPLPPLKTFCWIDGGQERSIRGNALRVQSEKGFLGGVAIGSCVEVRVCTHLDVFDYNGCGAYDTVAVFCGGSVYEGACVDREGR